MVSRRRLLSRLTALERSTPDAAAHRALARSLAAARLAPIGHKPVVLPGGAAPSWWPTALNQAAALVPGYGASALEQLVLEPARVYERRALAGFRELTLLAAVQVEDRRLLLTGDMKAAVAKGRTTGPEEMHLQVHDLDDAEAIRAYLRELADSLTTSSLNGQDPDAHPANVLVVGQLTAAEVRSLRLDLWARGSRLDAHLDQPGRRAAATRARLRAFRGAAVLVLQNRCGEAAGDMLAAVLPSTRLLILGEHDPESLELEWRMELDEVDLETPEHARDPAAVLAAGDDHRSWKDIENTLSQLTSRHFVLTPRARKQIGGTSDYPYPGRMGDALTGLAALAEVWAATKTNVGGEFSGWAKQTQGLNVAMHDDELRARKLDTFVLDDQQHSREPHVKVDDAVPFSECGRIYFARDQANLRFIVDHVGLHLYRRKDW